MTQHALGWKFSAFLVSLGLIGCQVPIEDDPIGEECPEWSYEGAESPEAWGALCGDYSTCDEGGEQSPIDIVGAAPGAGVAPIFSYAPQVYSVVNTGETVRADAPAGNRITLDGVDYELLQFHFHMPSEHTVDGVTYAMELHLVHRDTDGNLAVVGLLIEPGVSNTTLSSIFSNLPPNRDDRFSTPDPVDLNAVLPQSSATFRYDGSLTTPPCAEGVRWNVMSETIELSQGQIDAFDDLFEFDTNRPVQPIGDRVISVVE